MRRSRAMVLLLLLLLRVRAIWGRCGRVMVRQAS